jgi:hypothetical protein
MNDHPDASELLDIARRTLIDEILPRLPQELRYSALMITNAMAIAGREHAASGDAEAELARLQQLLNDRQEPLPATALHSALTNLNRRLAAEIRAGRFDGDARAALLEHLEKTGAAKLAVANPKALNQ